VSAEQWWSDEDVAVAWTAVDRHTAPHQETGEAHNGNACLTNDVLTALTPTVERIRREAKAEAWDEGYGAGDPWQRRGNPAEEKRRLNPYRLEAGGSDE